VLARPPHRRPAEFLPLRREQPLRGNDRQTTRRGDARQLHDAAGDAGRALSRAPRPQALDRALARDPADAPERASLAALIQGQAATVDLANAEPAWRDAEARVAALGKDILELEYALIPHGLHVVGEPPSEQERVDLLLAIAESSQGARPERAAIEAIVRGEAPDAVAGEPGRALMRELAETNRLLAQDHELPGLIHALDGGFVRPAPGGDLLRTPAVLPTGRNLHGFDPFRIPSAFAVADGARQAARLLGRHLDDGRPYPETIALVLWGTDNLKSEGGPIAQAMALIGARPRFDSYGRLAGAALIPLGELLRPRVDVVATLSGIFRDLLPLQTKMLAEASFLAASADEPLDQNFVRKHALAYQAAQGGDLETAALRVFSNADGAYGSNVNQMIDSSCWSDEDELAETYTRRKCFAYGRNGQAVQQAALLKSIFAGVDLAYQNLESVELGVTTVDHYFDSLGGISRAVGRAKGETVPVYIGDQTRGEGTVRTLSEQVAIETRTRMLNPKWYEGMLKHGYEGVRQIEAHVTNTMGWSATTGQVAPWVYQQLTQTYVLDAAMRERLAALNPKASAKVANRLIEAHERNYWTPDAATLAALRRAGDELEDRLEVSTKGWRHERDDRTSRAQAGPRAAGRRRIRPGAARSPTSRSARQGLFGLRQGRHRQIHDVVEPVGRVLEARQARAADRLRSEARLHLHSDQVAHPDRHRHSGRRRFPLGGASARGLRLRGL
jgi:magnesium chelatase subunit H